MPMIGSGTNHSVDIAALQQLGVIRVNGQFALPISIQRRVGRERLGVLPIHITDGHEITVFGGLSRVIPPLASTTDHAESQPAVLV